MRIIMMKCEKLERKRERERFRERDEMKRILNIWIKFYVCLKVVFSLQT